VKSGWLVKEQIQMEKEIWRGTVPEQMNGIGADVMFEFWKGKE